MGSQSNTCHPAEVTFPPLPQPIKAGTRFSHPRGMLGWVDLVGLVTYRGGIPARRRSPIPALTGLNVEQLRSCDERRYHSAKPLRKLLLVFKHSTYTACHTKQMSVFLIFVEFILLRLFQLIINYPSMSVIPRKHGITIAGVWQRNTFVCGDRMTPAKLRD